MNYSVFDASQSKDIIDLFTRVFSDSEGEEEGITVGHFVSELIETDARDLFGFVTTEQEQVVAGIFFSRLTFQEGINAFILSPVAVDTNYQRKGIGQQLIRYGFRHLKEHGVELVVTYGDPNYYEKVGFQSISEKHIKAPLELTHPEGWLGQLLTGDEIKSQPGTPRCVKALNKPALW